MKKLNKKRLVCVLLIILIVVFGIFKILKSRDVKEENNTENQVVEIISDSPADEETPDVIDYINISNENKILACSVLGEFDNGKNLSIEQYLSVVYNALNSGYIGNNSKITYSEEEVKNIVYSIFNVELTENKSVEGLNYSEGVYKLDKNTSKKEELQNVESDVAAGSLYMMYEFNGNKYIAKLTTNGVTGENYVSSIISND